MVGGGENIFLIYRDLDSSDKYSNEILTTDKKFDIIVIDGRERIKCTKNAVNAIKEEGIIIFDNSDVPSYKIALDFLKDNGFKELEFRGMGPCSSIIWSTSIFYRDKNCFLI